MGRKFLKFRFLALSGDIIKDKQYFRHNSKRFPTLPYRTKIFTNNKNKKNNKNANYSSCTTFAESIFSKKK